MIKDIFGLNALHDLSVVGEELLPKLHAHLLHLHLPGLEVCLGYSSAALVAPQVTERTLHRNAVL